MTERSGETMKNATRAVLDLDPMLIQSWYDGELDKSALENTVADEIAGHPMVAALEELGALVRADVGAAFSDFDEDGMWSAIRQEIQSGEVGHDAKAACEIAGVRHPSRVPSDDVAWRQPSQACVSRQGSSLRARIVRWIPTLVGAALFLFSLPGLITMIQLSDNDKVSAAAQSAQTVVVVEANAVDPATQSAINYAAQKAWKPSVREETALIPHARINTSEDQLTVEEMDKALKLVLQRLESLEQQNQERLERGEMALQPAL